MATISEDLSSWEHMGSVSIFLNIVNITVTLLIIPIIVRYSYGTSIRHAVPVLVSQWLHVTYM